jgi:hypothetical protein
MPDPRNTAERCPFCASDKLVKGTIGGSDALAYFQPSDLKLVKLTLTPKSVPFPPGHPATACQQCGRLWTEVDAEALAKVLSVWRRS